MRTEMSTTSLNQAPTVRAGGRLGNPGNAGSTGAKNINDVLRIAETVLCGDLFGPGFHCRRFDFRGLPALPTNQVVVVTR